MATHRVRRNDPCPCGSGKKYKKCCRGKAFDFVEDEDDGQIYRKLPLNEELVEALREQRQSFIEVHGREPGPGDKVFLTRRPPSI